MSTKKQRLLSIFHSLPCEVVFNLVKVLELKDRVSLFYTSRSVSDLMIHSGCFSQMPIKNPRSTLWFYDNITSCVIDGSFMSSVFPRFLEKLRITDGLMFYLYLEITPKTLRHLVIEDSQWDDYLYIPDLGLTSLEIKCKEFNQPLDNLPKSLKCLTVSSNNFNQPLNVLPLNVTHVTINSPKQTHTVTDKKTKLVVNKDLMV